MKKQWMRSTNTPEDLHLLPVGAATPQYMAIVEQASARDRCYFEQHPEMRSYIRAAIPGELGPPLAVYEGAQVLVLQIKPGARVRRLVRRTSSEEAA